MRKRGGHVKIIYHLNFERTQDNVKIQIEKTAYGFRCGSNYNSFGYCFGNGNDTGPIAKHRPSIRSSNDNVSGSDAGGS